MSGDGDDEDEDGPLSLDDEDEDGGGIKDDDDVEMLRRLDNDGGDHKAPSSSLPLVTVPEVFRNFVRTRQAPPLPLTVAHECGDLWMALRRTLQRIQEPDSIHAALVECVCRRRGFTRPRAELCTFFGVSPQQLRDARVRLRKRGLVLDYDRVKAVVGLVDFYLLQWWLTARAAGGGREDSQPLAITTSTVEQLPALAPLRTATANLVRVYYALAAKTAPSSAVSSSSSTTKPMDTGDGDDGDDDEDDEDEKGAAARGKVPAGGSPAPAPAPSMLPTLAVKEATVAATCLFVASVCSKVERIGERGAFLNRDYLAHNMGVSLKALNICIKRLAAAGVHTGDDCKTRRVNNSRNKAGRSLLSVPLEIVDATRADAVRRDEQAGRHAGDDGVVPMDTSSSSMASFA